SQIRNLRICDCGCISRFEYNTSPLRPLYFSSFDSSRPHHYLHSFPTRRSSDLHQVTHTRLIEAEAERRDHHLTVMIRDQSHRRPDRKSTRLNSSHVKISYAVFCLKKKKKRLIVLLIIALSLPGVDQFKWYTFAV